MIVNGEIQMRTLSHHFMASRWGDNGNSDRLFSWASKITMSSDCSSEIIRCLLLGRKAMTNIDSTLKSRDTNFADKGPYRQSYGFSSSRVWMWELDHKEGWVPKNWCFQTVVLEKTLESPLDCKEIKPVNPKGNHPEYSLKRLMLKLKLQYLDQLMRRTDSLEKTLMLEKMWAGEEGGNRGWDGWMASLTWWTWVWENSRI